MSLPQAYQTPSGAKWFKDLPLTVWKCYVQEHRRKQHEMHKLEKQIKDYRESRRPSLTPSNGSSRGQGVCT